MRKYDIAAYIWPAYHYEPRAEKLWPEKDGEWYTVRRGAPRFPGHDMPKIPLLGYQNEADPEVMRQHVEIGAKYGVNTFIMDWYWYDNKPCFEKQLNEGLIPALEGSDSRFYLMWANHTADTLWDMHTDERKVLWDGKVSREVFEPMMERIIDKYFTLDSYYTIDGKPVFSIFSLACLIVGLGGVDKTRDALNWLRKKVHSKGLPGIHIQLVIPRGNCNAPEAVAEFNGVPYADLPSILGVDSGTSYQFVADAGFNNGDYVKWSDVAISKWAEDKKNYPVLFPHVSVGWDNTQRNPSINEAITNSTPYAFEACLHRAKMYVDLHPEQAPLITINSWNEWTEGSYLLPDMRWGYRYLEAIEKVFANKTNRRTAK